MSPDANQSQPAHSASLPPVAAPLQAGAVSVHAQPGAPQSGGPVQPQQLATEQAVLKAQQLVAQHQNDPFHLSTEVQQLKSQYLAEHYGITVVRPEDI